MMRRFLLLLCLAAALGVLVIDRRVAGQPGEEFGVLKTSAPKFQPTAPVPAGQPAGGESRGLPTGIEPVGAGGAPALPVNPYPLDPTAGAWLVCAAHYVGPDGAELARQVAQQLREKHRLAAYIYNRGDEERRRRQQEWQELQKRYPNVPIRRRGVRITDQYAVLVGGFKDFASASEFLPRVRALPLPELKLADGRSPYEHMFYTEVDADKKPVVKKATVNPFHNAMVVRNPDMPNASNRPRWDPFWKTLNADEEYSLLKNPKGWTLLVKEYFGGRVVQQRTSTGSSFLNMLGLSSKPGDALDAAAMQARELARFLRHPRFGFHAYVLHTRYSSIVTIGAFDSADDPDLQRVVRQVSALRFSTNKSQGDPIGLLGTPVPIEVPRP